jgi:hypothetical protein
MTWEEFLACPEAADYNGPCGVCGARLEWWHPAGVRVQSAYVDAIRELGPRCVTHYYGNGTVPGDTERLKGT